MKKLLIITMIICLFPLFSYGDEVELYKSASEIAGNMIQDRQQARIMTEEMAQCMNAGMSSGDMKRIAITLQTQTRNMSSDAAQAYYKASLGTVKQMAQAGASSGSTANAVRYALKQKYNAKEMGQLGTTFSAQVKNSGSATKLANAFANAIKNGATADNVGTEVAKGSGGSKSQGATNSGSWNTGGSTGGGFGNSGGSGSGGGRGR